MELIKKPFRLGNSAGVLVPKRWMNSKIIVRPLESTTIEVIKILDDEKILDDVIGVYLIGSHAREDYDKESDIDVLVITSENNKLINKDNYEITIVSEKNFLKNLSKNLYSLSSIREAIPLINKKQLEIYKKIKSRININEFIKEIERTLRINQDTIEFCKDYKQKVSDGTIYSLVLRLRELYILKSIISNKRVSKKDFLSYIDRDSYRAYLRIKREQKPTDNVNINKADKLIEIMKKWLRELKERRKASLVLKKK